jgi:hypothetical protein
VPKYGRPPATFIHAYVVLYCCAAVTFALGVTAAVLVLNGWTLNPLPNAFFIISGTLTVLALNLWLAGRREDGVATRPIVFERPQNPKMFVGVTGFRYGGTVPMPKLGSDTTVYGASAPTMEQEAVRTPLLSMPVSVTKAFLAGERNERRKSGVSRLVKQDHESPMSHDLEMRRDE